MKLVKEDGHTTKEHQETRDFLVRSIVRDITFKKQEMSFVERELKELMSLLDFQLDSMPGIDLVTDQLNNSPELASQFGMESGKISARDIKK